MAKGLFSAEEVRTANASWLRMFFVKWFGKISCDYDCGELITFSTFGGERYVLYRTNLRG